MTAKSKRQHRHRMSLLSLLSLAWFVVGSVVSGCKPAAQSKSDVQVPPKQFVAEGVTIEETRDGMITWSGTAERASGDLSGTHVWNVKVTRHPGEKGETPIWLVAPTGTLAFDEGQATFANARIKTPDGAELRTPEAEYKEKSNQLVAKGPLAFKTHGLHAEATGGIFYLKEGRVEFAGPIVGRWVPPSKPRHTP